MATVSRTDRKRAVRKRATARVKRKSKTGGGLNVDDLVGKLRLTVDPLDYQRKLRDEW